ncbi:TIGR03663 family protein [Chloroflexia bacterium SDU3-3]|nr:TIGR03663 family protein [Chloroflexia bacterium SDU3-3]
MSALPSDSRDYAAPPAIDRVIEFTRVNTELVAYAALVILSIVAHIWGLGHMAMHHDESIHAWMSWKFFTGSGGFTCANGGSSFTYCYDPVYHGPALYTLTLISYFLFGIGEAQARMPQAVAGVVLVASCWMLRPLIGRRGAFSAAALLAFAPSILYYTRFARHDGLMLLWTLWIVVGMFRFLQEGKARWLYLLSAGAVLAVATHELWYILVFLFGFYLLVQLLVELLPRRPVIIGLGVLVGAAVLIELVGTRLLLPKMVSGLGLLVGCVSLVSLLALRVADRRPLFVRRFRELWAERRVAVWVALGLFFGLYAVLFTTYFTYPKGLIDGFVAGISYWLGSQQEYARGKQPWYYYLMLMPLYEPLGFFGSISASIALLARRAPSEEVAAESKSFDADPDQGLVKRLFPLFLVFWFFGSLVAYSWAGEKMPWLVTHIALPGNLLFAWGLGKLLGRMPWRDIPTIGRVVIPSSLVLLLITIGVMFWRLTDKGSVGMTAGSSLIAGLVPLVVSGVLIFIILTLAQRIGWRATGGLAVLTVCTLLALYSIRASWMVVYDHPDTPRELLIYTQSSPDVPLIVNDLNTLAISQTRNSRTDKDDAGGLSMPVIIDNGDSSGDGSLSWPFQWYLRDYQRLENRSADFFRDATANSFDVTMPDGSTKPAPVVMAYSQHITPQAAKALEANYVKRYDSKLNWWFPEGDLSGCNPETPGYKQFFYSSWSVEQAKADKDCASIDFATAKYQPPLAPIAWVFDQSHWPDLWRFVMWRDLPEPLQISGREMQVWVRKDLAPAASTSAPAGSAGASSTLRLMAEQAVGSLGGQEGQLTEPRSAAVDSKGNIYVVDTASNRVTVYSPEGAVLRTFGSLGAGPGQFNEPRGIAVDLQGNIYVADTWNARIAKFDANGTFLKSWGEGKEDFGNGRTATTTDRSEAGNQANQLGFFGPRGVAVDSKGNVYITDTGNRRVVVTDTEGNYRYQWGYEGSQDGQFTEPIGIAVDSFGNVYVADVWNGRVQVFSTGIDQVSPTPSSVWSVPGWQANSYDDPFIAVSPDGRVYVTVPGENLIRAYTANGEPLLSWGGSGNDLASMNLPTGIATDASGNVYATDRGNGRVLRFRVPAVAPSPAGQ